MSTRASHTSQRAPLVTRRGCARGALLVIALPLSAFAWTPLAAYLHRPLTTSHPNPSRGT